MSDESTEQPGDAADDTAAVTVTEQPGVQVTNTDADDAQTVADEGAKLDVDHWRNEARRWEARAKGNKTAQDQLAALSKVLNPDADADTPVDADALTGQLAAAQSDAQNARTELTIYRAANTAGVDPDQLTDSRRFMDAIGKLDPASDSYTNDVEAAIETARKNLPQVAKPVSSGGETGAGTNATLELDPRKLAERASSRRAGKIQIH